MFSHPSGSSSPLFSLEQLQQQLNLAFQEVSNSNKHVYLTSIGIQALATAGDDAQMIDPNRPNQAIPSIMKRLEPQTNTKDSYSKAIQIFSGILQKHASPRQPTMQMDIKSSPPPLRIYIKSESESQEFLVQLRHTAEIEGFGYKKANLDQVTDLCKKNYGPYKLEVPAYQGVSSGTIQDLLRDKCGLDLADRWRSIIEKHFPIQNLQIRDEILRSKKFPDAFLADCALLQEQITAAFKALAEFNEDLLPMLEPLVKEVEQNNERLMVRSSGKEDTVELANAGGNESIPNVIPSSQNILLSIGAVISSYFSEKSLKQRLGAADSSLFDPDALTPVLIQRMIGEKDSLNPPKCGVMFTEDSESRLSGDRPATATSGITLIQSSMGHPTGVTDDLIPVDTFYANNEGMVFPIFRPKTHRMVPTEQSGELQLQANSPTSASAPSLSVEASRTLKNFAQELEKFYGRPMDVEFAVDETEKKIYIVQVRPLIHRGDPAAASYVPDPKRLNAIETIKGSTIGAAGGGILLAQSDEVIVASTLSKALDEYQSCDNPGSIKVIVVGKEASSTSHWATIFRNEEKPVVHIKQLADFESWLKNPNAQILVSPQQGLIASLAVETTPSLEELFVDGICVKGWIEYPAPLLFSTFSEFSHSEKLTEEAIKEICPILHNPGKWSLFQKNAVKFKLNDVFTALRTSRGTELEMHLAVLLFLIKRTYDRRRGILDEEQLQRVDTLQSNALAIAKNVKVNGEYQPNDPNYCCKLLPIHFLRALIYAQASSDEVVGGDSIAFDLREIDEEQHLAAELEKEGIVLTNPYSLSLLRLGRVALNPEMNKQYRDFIVELDQAGQSDDLKVLATLIGKLNKFDLLVAWLNLVFPHNPNIPSLLKTYVAQAPFLNELAQKTEALRAINIFAFGHRKSFEAQWRTLNVELLDFVESDRFFENYKNADVLGKLAAGALMRRIVDQFDLAIKTLEGSSKNEYSIELKINLFHKMLTRYCELAKKWVGFMEFIFHDSSSNPCDRMNSIMKFIDELLKKFQENLEDPSLADRPAFLVKNFKFSPGFDGMAYSSKIDSVRAEQHPSTLEDGFSVIHRELLGILNLLNESLSYDAISMVPLLRNITQRLHLGLGCGMELNLSGITVYYTEQLREHGIQYCLNQPIGREKATLSVRFSAVNEDNRWDIITHYMVLLKAFGKFDLSDFEIGSYGCGFTFHLDGKDNLQTLNHILQNIKVASNNIEGGTDLLPVSSVNNDTKGSLPSSTNNVEIVKEIERYCGIKSMLADSMVVENYLKKAMVEDIVFAGSFLGRMDLSTASPKFLRYLDITYLKKLVELGYTNPNILHLVLSFLDRDNENQQRVAIQLLHVIAQNNPFAFSSWDVENVLNYLTKKTVNIENKKIVQSFLEFLQGKRPELITEYLTSRLEERMFEEDRDQARIVLELLASDYPLLLAPVLKHKLSPVIKENLAKLTKKNASAVLIEMWKITDLNYIEYFYLNNILPKRHINSGLALTVIANRGLYLLESPARDNIRNGIQLLYAVAKKDLTALPDGCVWLVLRKLAKQVEWDADTSNLFFALFKERQEKLIEQSFIPAVTSMEGDDGMAVLTLLIRNFPHYFTQPNVQKLRPFVKNYLEKALIEDPSKVEAFLSEHWDRKNPIVEDSYLNNILPIKLANTGRGLETLFWQALGWLRSPSTPEDIRNGMQLLHAVMKNDPSHSNDQVDAVVRKELDRGGLAGLEDIVQDYFRLREIAIEEHRLDGILNEVLSGEGEIQLEQNDALLAWSLLKRLVSEEPQSLCEEVLQDFLGIIKENEDYLKLAQSKIENSLISAITSPEKDEAEQGMAVLKLIVAQYPEYLTSSLKQKLPPMLLWMTKGKY